MIGLIQSSVQRTQRKGRITDHRNRRACVGGHLPGIDINANKVAAKGKWTFSKEIIVCFPQLSSDGHTQIGLGDKVPKDIQGLHT
ncbi:MAG: hypothetical protein WA822_03870, partial [Albidovulum sp.]